jgi:iron(III) transport system substrate-binding protein
VFWSSELFNTMILAREGLLQPYRSPAADDIPERYRDPAGYWTATALRGRALAYNPNKTKGEGMPKRWQDLAEVKWASRLAIANPISGTTRGHVAAMFALWGPEQGKAFLTSLREGGALVVDGNSMAVRLVGRGERDWCATDTDDVWVAQERGEPVDLVYPDMGDGGTLLIPCSAALVAGARHEAGGRRLIDYLVSAKVERLLAESDSRNIPVRQALREELGIAKPAETRIGYDRIADAMGEAVDAAREILLR